MFELFSYLYKTWNDDIFSLNAIKSVKSPFLKKINAEMRRKKKIDQKMYYSTTIK